MKGFTNETAEKVMNIKKAYLLKYDRFWLSFKKESVNRLEFNLMAE